MVWVYEALEICNRRGHPTGRFRLARWRDDKPDELFGLCEHAHLTTEEALNCPNACSVLNHEFRERPVKDESPAS